MSDRRLTGGGRAVLDLPDVAEARPRSKAEQARGHIYPIIVENMRDGVLAFNGRGKIIAINTPARVILGSKAMNGSAGRSRKK